MARNIYVISEADVQDYAKDRIGRRLSQQEMRIVEKGVNEGISFGIEDILDAAIDTVTEQ